MIYSKKPALITCKGGFFMFYNVLKAKDIV